jgi:hypothetical protein
LDTLHLVLGVAVIVTNLLAGAWGGVSWLQQRPSVSFWYLLRAAQVAVVLQVLVGGLLVLLGEEATGALHYVYGLAPLLVSLLAEAARAGAAESTSRHCPATASGSSPWRSSVARWGSWPPPRW